MRNVTVLVLLIGLVINGVLTFLIFRNSDHITKEAVPLFFASVVSVGLCAYLVTELEGDSTAYLVFLLGAITELLVIRTLLKRKRKAA